MVHPITDSSLRPQLTNWSLLHFPIRPVERTGAEQRAEVKNKNTWALSPGNTVNLKFSVGESGQPFLIYVQEIFFRLTSVWISHVLAL